MNPSFSPPMVLWAVDSNEVLRVSRTFVEALGLSRDELSSSALLEWIHEEDRAGLEARLKAGEGCVTARHRTADGGWMAFDWQVRRQGGMRIVMGLGGRGCASVVQEVSTSLRATMAETLDAMARIVELKNPGLLCSILLVDEAHERVTVGAGPSLPAEYNAAVEGLAIGPAVGSCGTAAFWNVPVVVEDIAQDPLWRELRETAALAGVGACWSHPITSTAGEVLGAMALYDTRPSVPTQHQMDELEIAARMVGMAVERDRLEAQLREATKMEAIGVLAGGIAHDFNNLLTTVMGNAELLMSTMADGEATQMLQEIVTASVNATGLCNQMLTYAGRGAVSTETLECNELVRELGGLLQVALSKKASLVYELHPEPLGLLVDRSQLRQVIMNLITNAAEAIGEREGRIVLGSGVRTFATEDQPGAVPAPGEYVHLWVSDSGVGMEPRTQARMFDPFFTTKPTGRGLGLAAVKGIVHGHRGSIQVDSSPGRGTRVSIWLPRVPLGAQAPSGKTTQGAGGVPARLLVVDDEEHVRRVLAGILESAGHEVLEAGDGEEAIDVFRREGDGIDCVLLDLSMPKLDGEEVFAELRRIRPGVRVVLSSGFTEQEILDRFQGAGLAGVIQKPAQMHVLLAKIAEALVEPTPA